MTLREILVGVDFSAEAEVAVERAMRLARRAGARVVLVHAGPLPERPTLLPEFLPPAENEDRERLTEQLRAERARLEELRQRLHGQGVELSHVFVDDRPHDGLARYAEERGAELVVVGTHGRTGIRRFALGSVAERVVRTASCSVLVARSGGRAAFERVLVPVDFSASTAATVESALAIAAPGAEVTLLHGWHVTESLLGVKSPMIDPPATAYAGLRDRLRAQLEARGEALVEAHGSAGVSLRFVSIEAPPAQAIAEWLDEHEVDLVVMGSHGRRGLSRLLIGSVAETTVRHAPCSVLIVRERGAA